MGQVLKKQAIQKYAVALAALPLIGGLVFLSGPRINLDYSPRPLDLPEDLDAYLQATEARYPDIVAGTEKQIVWANSSKQQTQYAVVFLHGFSASRQEIAPLPAALAQSLGANLFATRFHGHGRGGPAMLEGSVNDWLNDAQEALEIGKRLGQNVIVIGLSTGGSAATWLAAQNDPKLAACVLISPNYGLANASGALLAWPWGGHLAEWVIGKEREWKPLNAEQAKYWTWKYPVRALLPMMGMVKTVQSLNFEQIMTPTLMIYSPQDKVVNTRITNSYFQRLGAPHKKRWLYTQSPDPEQHVIAGDIVSPGTTATLRDGILAFIQEL